MENSENHVQNFDGNGGAPMDNLTGQQSTNDVDCQKVFVLATAIQLLNIITADI